MDPYVTLSLVDYIQLLHGGPVAKSLFTCFEADFKNCSPVEVNTAIENLIIRYKVKENQIIDTILKNLKKVYVKTLPETSIRCFLSIGISGGANPMYTAYVAPTGCCLVCYPGKLWILTCSTKLMVRCFSCLLLWYLERIRYYSL